MTVLDSTRDLQLHRSGRGSGGPSTHNKRASGPGRPQIRRECTARGSRARAARAGGDRARVTACALDGGAFRRACGRCGVWRYIISERIIDPARGWSYRVELYTPEGGAVVEL